MAAPSGKELDGKDRVRLRLHLREVANELYVGVAGIQCHDAGGEREHYSVTTFEASRGVVSTAALRTVFSSILLEYRDCAGLMRRIVAAGHELCNHMPHDRSYALLGEPAFAADLRAAEEALAPYQPQLPPPSARTCSARRWAPCRARWRACCSGKGTHPSSATSLGLATTSLWGAGRRGTQAGAATVAWHVEYCARRTKPGSVVIFHVPRARDRLSVVPITTGFLEWCESRGLSCVTASELAASHVGANNVLP